MSFEGDNHNDPPGSFHRNLYSVNGNIMLTVTASLSLVVIFVISLHVYARCVLRRQPRRRPVILSLDPVNYQLHYTEPPPPPPPQSSKAGLDPTVISALPIFVFKQTDGHDHDRHDHECAVCLSNFEGEEMARLLPNCKHVFHADCIDIWLASQSTCPICRIEAEPRLLQPESREGPVMVFICSEAASSSSNINSNGNVVEASSAKLVTESSSRLNSLRRILSGEWERSSTRHHPDDINHDLER